jgi:phosphoribosylanthranilate isomerase
MCGANGVEPSVIKAVRLGSGARLPENALLRKEAFGADYLLLDSGAGSGVAFDWRILLQLATAPDFGRSFFLAGGITGGNIREAAALRPFGIDVSSGIETYGVKDREKMITLKRSIEAQCGNSVWFPETNAQTRD